MTTAEAVASAYAARLERALPEVRARIERAAARAGRDPSEIRLVAVTKGHPLAAVEAALACGLRDIGENRVEELERKLAARGRMGAVWHMIGHVQGRKARRAAELADLIQSVDSLRLAGRLSRIAGEAGREVAVLVQVNTSGEAVKSGFTAGEAVERVLEVAELPGLRVEGLMTMAPFVDDESVLRSCFAALREIRERAAASSERVGPELSMGMTNDFEIAVEEGSTMVRVGTALFGPRPGGQP